jgi:DNA repair protein RadC
MTTQLKSIEITRRNGVYQFESENPIQEQASFKKLEDLPYFLNDSNSREEFVRESKKMKKEFFTIIYYNKDNEMIGFSDYKRPFTIESDVSTVVRNALMVDAKGVVLAITRPSVNFRPKKMTQNHYQEAVKLNEALSTVGISMLSYAGYDYFSVDYVTDKSI